MLFRSPVSIAIQKLIPLPKGPNANAIFNNYINPFLATRITDITSIKNDHTISAKQKVSFFWSLTKTYSPTSTALGAEGLPDPISQARGNYTRVNTYRINYDYTVTPTMVLHVGAGFVDQNGPRSYTPSRNNFDPASIGLKGTYKTLIFPRFTGLTGANNTGGMVTMGQATGGGSPENPQGGIHSWRPGGNVSLTWIRGNHTFKGGAEAIIGNYTYPQQFTSSGVFNFSANSTSDSGQIGRAHV